MKYLAYAFVILFTGFLSLAGSTVHAASGIKTEISPQPPYAPGTRIRVKISGPGMSQIQDTAFFHLIGKNATDFMQTKMLLKSDRPPVFEWTFVAPKRANTMAPRLVIAINYKNGVAEELNAENTPAFRALQFTGIQLDQEPPALSNLKFTQHSPGRAKLEFDANDPSGVDPLGGAFYINEEVFMTEHTSCKRTGGVFHCTSDATFPSQAQGSIRFELGIGDKAGNRNELQKKYKLQNRVPVDQSKPQVLWPIRATICSDRVIRLNFNMSGGGGSLFQGLASVWSTNESTNASSSGIAEQGLISCKKGSCRTTFSAPDLVGLGQGSLNATVNDRTSRSNVGGIKTENVLDIDLYGVNGQSSRYRLPPSVVNALDNIPKGERCNVVLLSPSGPQELGTTSKKSGEAATAR